MLAASGIDADVQGASFTYALNGFEATLDEEPGRRARAPGQGRQRRAQHAAPPDDRQHAEVPRPVRAGAARGRTGYTGENVVVGVIDTGIWPEHPSFTDDGVRPLLAGAQGHSPATSATPRTTPTTRRSRATTSWSAPVTCGDTYTAVIGRPEPFNSARDPDGHGTHTARTPPETPDVAATIFGIDTATVTRHRPPRTNRRLQGAAAKVAGFTSDLAARSIRPSPTVSTSSTTRSAATPASLQRRRCRLPVRHRRRRLRRRLGRQRGPGAGTVGGPAVVPWLTAVGASTPGPRRSSGTVKPRQRPDAPSAPASPPGTAPRQPLVDAADARQRAVRTPTGTSSAPRQRQDRALPRGGIGRADKSLAVRDAGGAGMILFNHDRRSTTLATDNHLVPTVHVNYTDGAADQGVHRSARSAQARLDARRRAGSSQAT